MGGFPSTVTQDKEATMQCGWGRFYGGSSHPFPIHCLSSGHLLSAFLASDSLASCCPQETLLSLFVRLISSSLPAVFRAKSTATVKPGKMFTRAF